MNTTALKPMGIEKLRKRMPVATMTDPKILVPAIGDAFKKLRPAAS